MTRVAFCNNNGGGGKSTLVFHLAHMLADLGRRTLIVDLDPQSSLTAMCVSEERLEALWSTGPAHSLTIMGGVRQLLAQDRHAGEVHVEPLRDGLGLVAGDLGLSSIEQALAAAWEWERARDEASLRELSVFHRVIEHATAAHDTEIVLINAGPNLGAINRAALLAADVTVIPIAPDLFAVQGLRSLGLALAEWRLGWEQRVTHQAKHGPEPGLRLGLPEGRLMPLGYVVMQAAMRLARPVLAYDRWLRQVPTEYHDAVVRDAKQPTTTADDPWCLGSMRPYPGLALLARDARKPMFHLRPADGATGAHATAVLRCRDDFARLAAALLTRIEETKTTMA
ncbi:ParA family protein [Paraliomyxa miuraensis]|uniref:ParA family protein n=1 Tax=Paraliomyxa miuraensis TaxID=376150 RepID=UPI0022569A98|nr:ParA family protein [Paraliomyxa miuraensis]MCX4240763.1 ParA family protein [Paraliomyxa miuraensis]